MAPGLVEARMAKWLRLVSAELVVLKPLEAERHLAVYIRYCFVQPEPVCLALNSSTEPKVPRACLDGWCSLMSMATTELNYSPGYIVHLP
jgi:hypothetical protein